MFVFFYSRMEQSQTTGKMKPCNILGKSASPCDTTRLRFFASTQLSVWNRNWAQKSSSSFISNIRWSHLTCTSWEMSRCVSNFPKSPSGITTTYRQQLAVVHTFFFSIVESLHISCKLLFNCGRIPFHCYRIHFSRPCRVGSRTNYSFN